MIDRVHRELTDADIARIASTYHAWRGDRDAGEYADVPGFCKSATLDEIRMHGHVLTPGRYVGVGIADEDDEPFDEKMALLVAVLNQQQSRSSKTGRHDCRQPGGTRVWRPEWRIQLLGDLTENFDYFGSHA
jgi:type I restriction enzyme M protein